MRIQDFAIEMYMNEYEAGCRYNLAETCVSSLTVDELLTLCGRREEALAELLSLRMTYGHITGSPGFVRGICGLYKTVKPENVTTTHGAIGANALVFSALVEPGDEVVSIFPAYQQLYSLPEALGAKVTTMPLNESNGFLPDVELLANLMNERVKLVVINNPHNPSGAVMDAAYLQRIVDVVRPYGTYILCDEAYRGLTHTGQNLTESLADMYEHGISTSSMSKALALAGLRIGWVAAPEAVIEKVNKHRDYTLISCGVADDYLDSLALEHSGKIFARNIAIARANLDVLDAWVTREPHFSFVRPQGGTTAFIKLGFDMPSREFCLGLLEDTGVMVVPGSAMGVEGYIRVGYAFEKDLLEKGLGIISAYVKEIVGS
ncbi:MAG: aminotransferase [Defluviitaleaceae bacterium]|nr:aminotransferase [Defluviitaleaceae bacterium]